jgi:hypothetical protein
VKQLRALHLVMYACTVQKAQALLFDAGQLKARCVGHAEPVGFTLQALQRA